MFCDTRLRKFRASGPSGQLAGRRTRDKPVSKSGLSLSFIPSLLVHKDLRVSTLQPGRAGAAGGRLGLRERVDGIPLLEALMLHTRPSWDLSGRGGHFPGLSASRAGNLRMRTSGFCSHGWPP